jgi:hypothetical protein
MKMEENQYRKLTEGASGEILNILSSINDILLLTEYCKNSPETNSYLSLVSVCIARLNQIMEEPNSGT